MFAAVMVLADTALHLCVKHNFLDAVRVLLTHGSDVNHLNALGQSPLHVAVSPLRIAMQIKQDNVSFSSVDEIVHCLVKNGYNTDINLPDSHGH